MKRLVYLASASAAAVLVATGSDANAQDALLSPPPQDYTVDARGVDLLSGRAVRNTRLVAIGEPGAGGLSYDRTYVSGSWRDNVTGTMTATGTGRSILSVSIGGVTDVFTKSGTTFTPSRNLGQSLTLAGDIYTYRSSDGVEYRFSKGLADQRLGVKVTLSDEARLSNIVYPNGEIVSFSYEVAEEWGEVQGTPEEQKFWAIRLNEVSNNFGYVLRFDYQQAGTPNYLTYPAWQRLQKVTAYNRAQCGSGPNSCGMTWPSVTFNGGQITDQSGRTSFYGSQGVGVLVLRTPENPTVDAVRYTTDNTLRVTSVTKGGSVWNYSYSEASGMRAVTITAPDSSITTAQVNLSSGLLSSSKDALNRVTGYEYDASRRLSKITYPALNSTGYLYDARGNITRITASSPPSVNATPLIASASYPSSCVNPVICNQPTSTTDARGNVTDYTYDSTHGGVLTITEPAPTTGAARPQTRISYAPQTAYYKNSAGSIVAAPTSVTLPTAVSTCAVGAAASCVGTAAESRTTLTYGSAGVANNLLPTISTVRDGTGALSATTALTYTATGDVASVDGPLSGSDDTTYYRYDVARQRIGAVGPDPDGGGSLQRRAQRLTYNGNGAVTLAEQGTVAGLTDSDWSNFSSLQQTAVAYDAYGRPTHQRAQAGGSTHSLVQISYDASGRQDCVATRMNPSTFASPPASACTLGTAGAFGSDRITKYGYDAAGQLISTTSGYGTGSPITESATYTANGKPLTLRDGNGNVSTMAYDGFDRLSRLYYPNASGGGSSTTDYQEYGYDAGSNVTSYRNRGADVFGVTYDALNRATLLDAPSTAQDKSFTYDLLGRTLTTVSAGQTLTNTWDALGRQTSAGSALGTVSYGYDLAGRRTSITWPDGFWAQYAYDNTGALTSVSEYGTGQLQAWVYDNLGRISYTGRGNGATTTYGYDAAGRVSSLAHDLAGTANDLTLGFTYNPAGQIATRTMSNTAYTYTPAAGTTSYVNNGKNQVTSVGGVAVGYGARGNMSTAPMGSYGFNGNNELIWSTVGGTTTAFSYDPAGRLYQSGTTRFLYDGVQAIGEYDTSGGLLRRYVPGVGLDNIVTAYEGSGTTDRRYPLSDERQSVISITNGSAGVIATNTYDEYGVPGSGNSGRFQYTGQIWLPEAQLYHYRARAYAPTLGRFMQTDPIGYQAGANLYGYVGSDPINLIDPLGLQDQYVDSVVITGSRCPSGSVCDLQSIRNIIDGLLDRYVNGPVAQLSEIVVIGVRSKEVVETNRYREPLFMLSCPVLEAEIVGGGVGEARVSAGIFELSGKADLGSVRGKFSVYDGFSGSVTHGLTGKAQIGVDGFGGSFEGGLESEIDLSTPRDQRNIDFQAPKNEGFVGFDVGGALILGAGFRAGYNAPSSSGNCP